MRKKSLLLLLIPLIQSTSTLPSPKNIEQLKKRYPSTVINYLYELALFDNVDPKKESVIKKWETDIYISIIGDTLSRDRRKIFKAINQLNSLNLPIKIHEATDIANSNVTIEFGSRNRLKVEGEILGVTSFDWSGGIIDKARIKIINEHSSTPLWNEKREFAISHEIVHLLGLAGHSFTHANSVLCTDFSTNFNGALTDVDKQVVRLLYEPALLPGLSCAEFEANFGDILYHVNSKIKLLKFVKANKVDKEILDSIIRFGLFNESVVKLSLPAAVTIQGDYPSEFAKIIKGAIQKLNSVANINLVFDQAKSSHFTRGIRYIFERDTSIQSSTETSISIETLWSLRFPRHLKTDISFKYKNQNSDSVRLSIANSLFRSLCFPAKTELFMLTKQNINLRPEYKQMLKVYYNTSLPSGFTKADLKYVADRLNKPM